MKKGTHETIELGGQFWTDFELCLCAALEEEVVNLDAVPRVELQKVINRSGPAMPSLPEEEKRDGYSRA